MYKMSRIKYKNYKKIKKYIFNINKFDFNIKITSNI
jgi:hypothetical protein